MPYKNGNAELHTVAEHEHLLLNLNKIVDIASSLNQFLRVSIIIIKTNGKSFFQLLTPEFVRHIGFYPNPSIQ